MRKETIKGKRKTKFLSDANWTNKNMESTHPGNIEIKQKKDRVDTFAFGASRAMRAAAALPALFSSMKLMVELMTSNVMIPTKSCQSGAFPCTIFQGTSPKNQPTNSFIANIKSQKLSSLTPPFASAIAIIAAASITHDRGFHINPKNFKNLLS